MIRVLNRHKSELSDSLKNNEIYPLSNFKVSVSHVERTESDRLHFFCKI